VIRVQSFVCHLEGGTTERSVPVEIESNRFLSVVRNDSSDEEKKKVGRVQSLVCHLEGGTTERSVTAELKSEKVKK